ncbi:MAG: response regulator [Vicingaceae bacterium]
MKCLIVDDEEMARKNLLRLCGKVADLEVVKTCENALEALQTLHNEEVDLLLLDIQMPDLSGMELVKHSQSLPQVIFTTNLSSFAVEAFEFDVTDYLTKPIRLPRFIQAIEKARKRQPIKVEKAEQSLVLKDGNEEVRLSYSDLLYLEYKADQIIFHLQNGKEYSAKHELNNLKQKLKSAGFEPIHPTLVVNVSKVEQVANDHLTIGKKKLPISPVHRPITSKW